MILYLASNPSTKLGSGIQQESREENPLSQALKELWT